MEGNLASQRDAPLNNQHQKEGIVCEGEREREREGEVDQGFVFISAKMRQEDNECGNSGSRYLL